MPGLLRTGTYFHFAPLIFSEARGMGMRFQARRAGTPTAPEVGMTRTLNGRLKHGRVQQTAHKYVASVSPAHSADENPAVKDDGKQRSGEIGLRLDEPVVVPE